jgi:Glycosyl transferase family 2
LSTVQPFSEPDRFATESIVVSPALAEQIRQPGGSSQVHQFGTGFNSCSFKLSILMAAYNEERTIKRAIDEILQADYSFEIELIVVDDGSSDATGMLLSTLDDDRLIVHRHSVNQGKGAALRTAMSLASGTHMLPFDADLEYVPEDIPKLLEPVLRGRCSVVYGVRLFGYNTVYRSYRYAMGNRLLTGLANILFDAKLSDLHTCLKLIPLPMLRDLGLNESGFGLDTEITALLLRRGVRPFEVPVTYYGRSHGQGKKITWRDALACIWILFRIRTWNRPYRISLDQAQEQLGRHDGSDTQPDAQKTFLSLPVSQTTAAQTSPDGANGRRHYLPEVAITTKSGGGSMTTKEANKSVPTAESAQ